MKTDKENPTPLEGLPPGPLDIFFRDWARESLKNNLQISNELLKQIITLSTGLLGINLIFETSVENPLLKLLAIIFLFLSIIVAFIGILPHIESVDINDPDAVRSNFFKAVRQKVQAIRWSAGFFMAAVGFIIAGMITKLASII